MGVTLLCPADADPTNRKRANDNIEAIFITENSKYKDPLTTTNPA
jgi:hypothetical protein